LDEKMKLDGEVSSALAMSSVKVSAIMDLPIKASEDALNSIRNIRSQSSYNTVILYLHPEQEVLLVDQKGKFGFDEVSKKLPANEPRFILSSYNHINEAEGKEAHAFVFIYYCPEDCKPKAKMFYSTSKAVVIKISESCEVPVTKNIEVSELKEISDALVLDELYPQIVAKKQFKKAGKPGKGGNRLVGKTKFAAN